MQSLCGTKNIRHGHTHLQEQAQADEIFLVSQLPTSHRDESEQTKVRVREQALRRNKDAMSRRSKLRAEASYSGKISTQPLVVTTRSIRDPVQGVYEYLEERHETKGVRLECHLFPVLLSGWVWRREGPLFRKFKRRFCVFDADKGELSIYKTDDTSADSGKCLQTLVVTRVEMTHGREDDEHDKDEVVVVGYDRSKELYKSDSDRIAERRSVSLPVWLPGEQQRFYRPKEEYLAMISTKAGIVWSHCFRHHARNYRRRKRMHVISALESWQDWHPDLLDQGLFSELASYLEEDEDDDGANGNDDEFVFKETKARSPHNMLRRPKNRDRFNPNLVFDQESDVHITTNAHFSSRGVNVNKNIDKAPVLRAHFKESSMVGDVLMMNGGKSRDDVRSGSSTSSYHFSSSQWMSSMHSAGSASIWEDDQLLSFRVDFDAIIRSKLLSSGACGEVWLASYRSKTVVAKTLKVTVNDKRRNHIRRFVREIHIFSQLNHERIVKFHGVAWTMESDVQLLMEYMPNGDLRSYLSHLRDEKQRKYKGGAPLLQSTTWSARQWRMAVDIIEGIVYLHSLNPELVHCDIKSRNLLLDSNMRVKIADFGIARFLDGHTDDECSSNQSIESPLSTFRAVGTGRWMAPEILAGGGAYSLAVDVYAFGVVLSEIDTFELPYHDRMTSCNGEELGEHVLLHHILVDNWKPQFSASCPGIVRQIAMECMAVDPQQRPTSLDVAYRLRKALQTEMAST